MAQLKGTNIFGTIKVHALTQSTSVDTGALVVSGGVGIKKNLNVGGGATVLGAITGLTFNGLTISNSNSTLSLGGNLTTSSHNITLTTSGITSIELPTSGILATTENTETLTNKTISGNSTWSGNIITISKGGTGLAYTTARHALLGPTSDGAPKWRAITVADISDIASISTGITKVGTISEGVWRGTDIANDKLANSSITVGATNISLGGSSTTLKGLTSVTSTSFVGELTGNASTATKLKTARAIALTGAVTGTANFDGSGNISIATAHTADPVITLTGDVSGSGTMTNLGNVSITATVADDSHNHVIGNIDGLDTTLGLKAPLTSPALTGIPTAPTANTSTNTTQIATTAFVSTAISNLVGSSPETLDTLNELATALGNDPNFATTVTTSIGLKADKTIKINVGGGLTGGGNLSTNVTISHPTGDGNLHVPATSNNNSGKVLTAGSTAGTLTWNTLPTIGNATLTVKASTGISLTEDPTFTANATDNKTITITNSAPNVTTNLSTTHSATTVVVNSSDGTNGTINAATTSLAGVMTNADKTKLDGISAGARTGTVTSVAMTVPTGLSISGTPITTNGTLALSLADGFAIPTTSNISTWNALVSNATHTGEVTGATSLTIASNVVDADNLKVTGNGTTSQYLRSNGDGGFTWATPPNDNTNYYPDKFSWTSGTTAGPTGSLSGIGMTAVGFGAIPSASATASGIVTTGEQTFSGKKTISGDLSATRVYNAVWNDIADFLEVDEDIDIEYGKAYFRDNNGKVRKTNKRNSYSIGIASDTFGFGVGRKDENIKQIPIAIGGWVLAYVDNVYKAGTALIATKDGTLTKASLPTKSFYPERIIAVFDREEKEEFWNKIKVAGRCWVKVK